MKIGIDPGITGAIAFIGNNYCVYDLPIMAKGKGRTKVTNQINPSALSELIRAEILGEGDVQVYLERVSSMPGQGSASIFSLGDSYGCIRGVVATMGLRLNVVTPNSWKKHFKLGKDKEVVRAKAIELFANAPLERKKDHDRAEALLIAQYGIEI